jgi:hypothetical protein
MFLFDSCETLGDAHGQGKHPVKPLPRHAELAVNMTSDWRENSNDIR